ncbi:UNVERIFIED_CONTAM: hypothetical protein Slati_3950500 [Sesamum latifolium]|uniref:Reverse transcriptase RNase H-like domain-containing protein n=1 Tax=Sesamum latifolium TaxID=2727402 RepID=A0AAW2TRX0_9LAMI
MHLKNARTSKHPRAQKLQGKLAYLRSLQSWLHRSRTPFDSLCCRSERSAGILLAQKNDEEKENSLYYLSRTMTPNKLKYSPIENYIWRSSLQSEVEALFPISQYSSGLKGEPSEICHDKTSTFDRLARWYLQLQQFEITYVPQKAVKGQVLADFLADHPMPAEWELSDDLPDEDVLVIEITPLWKMYFDGASHKEEPVLELYLLHLKEKYCITLLH